MIFPLRMVSRALMLAKFPAHRPDGGLGDRDLVRENLRRIAVAFLARVAMLSDQGVMIIGRHGIQAPERIADRTGLGHA